MSIFVAFSIFLNSNTLLLSHLIYTIGNDIYFLAIKLASLWNTKAKQWVNGRKQWMSNLIAFTQQNNKPIIWMHCASLGEFEQGRPVAEALLQEYPNYALVVTFFSPSGYEVQKDCSTAAYVCYLPINNKKNAQQFIDTLLPSLVLWVKYDFWSHYLKLLATKRIPTLLISAKFRTTQPFFKWYGGYWRQLLACFSQIFVQDAKSVLLLQTIDLYNAQIAGDTRFDRVVKLANEPYENAIIEKFIDDKKCIVAGSTWTEDDEELCHYANNNTQLKFIIAPHHINEERLQEIEKLYTNTIRYSVWKDDTTANVLLLDNMGMLSYIYRYATVCYVGGGFGSDGVHNTLEPAAYGKPIFFGPEFEKYQEAVDLENLYVATSINSALDLEENLKDLLDDTEDDFYKEKCMLAKNYVVQNVGSTHRIINYVLANRLLTKS